ncbi:MAG: BamA/TamA family outer membrane protein [Candidatus Eisenbacteria bacterium]
MRDSEESYRTYTERVDFSLLYRPTLKTNYRGGVRLSAVKLKKLTDDPEAFDESGGYATVFFGEALLDGADDRLNPSSGGIVSASAEVSVPQKLGYALSGAADQRHEVPRLIGTRLIGRPTSRPAGWARPIGNAQDLLPTERFFAGGVNSMRGFKRQARSPTQAAPRSVEKPCWKGLSSCASLIWGSWWVPFTDTDRFGRSAPKFGSAISKSRWRRIGVSTPLTGPSRCRPSSDRHHSGSTDDGVPLAIGNPY